MKFGNFRYHKATSVQEVGELLRRHGDSAAVLAGGQSLLAGMSMRLATLELIVDIGGLNELRGIMMEGASVRIGALTRHAEVLASTIVKQHLPLLSQATRHVAHVAIRNSGTFGGSLANADPAAELPACVVTLEGIITATGPDGTRQISAADFFTGLFETALKPGEIITEVRLPVQTETTLSAFAEISRRQGDFALAGLATTVRNIGGRLADPRCVYFGCTDRARLAPSVSDRLAGARLPLEDPDALSDTLEDAIRYDIQAVDSPGLRADTKLKLAKAVTARVLRDLNGRVSP